MLSMNLSGTTPLSWLPWWLSGKESATMQERQFQSLGQEDPLEEGMATHSSILAWEVPWRHSPQGGKRDTTEQLSNNNESVCPLIINGKSVLKV